MRNEIRTNRTIKFLPFLQIDSNLIWQKNNEYLTTKPCSARFAMMKMWSLTKRENLKLLCLFLFRCVIWSIFLGKFDKHKTVFYTQNKIIWIMAGDKMKVSFKFIDISYFSNFQQFIPSLLVVDNILKFQIHMHII